MLLLLLLLLMSMETTCSLTAANSNGLPFKLFAEPADADKCAACCDTGTVRMLLQTIDVILLMLL
jgi:hypothetical protein